MRRTFRITLVNLKKSIFSFSFFVCCIVTAILMFTSTAYIDSKEKEYSVFYFLLNKSKISTWHISPSSFLSCSISPFLTLFFPILSALPFVSFFTTERRSKNIRFVIHRIGKNAYQRGLWLSAMVIGGLTVLTGFAIYTVCIFIAFPYTISEFALCTRLCFGMIIYGMVSVIPAYLLSILSRNFYLICCLPYILMSFWYTLLNWYVNYLINDNPGERANSIIECISFLYPNNIVMILGGATHPIIMLIFYSALMLVSYFLFSWLFQRKTDIGE